MYAFTDVLNISIDCVLLLRCIYIKANTAFMTPVGFQTLPFSETLSKRYFFKLFLAITMKILYPRCYLNYKYYLLGKKNALLIIAHNGV